MKALALGMAALLALSVFSMLPSADAQTSAIGSVMQRICARFLDGTSSCLPSTTFQDFNKATITSTGGKEVVSYGFETLVTFYQSGLELVSNTGMTHSVRVLAPDETYAAVGVSGGKVSPPQKITIGIVPFWRVYQSSVSVSTLEAIIGSHAADYTGDIRITSTPGTLTIRTISTGQTFTAAATSQTTSLSFIGKATGGGGCIGSGCVEEPSGIIHHVYQIIDQNGSVQYSSASLDVNPFTLAGLQVEGVAKELYKIKYMLLLHMDNDNFIMPTTLTYQNPSATDNYNILVNNQGINKVVNPIIQRQSSVGGNYFLLVMTADRADIEGPLTVFGSEGNLQYLEGDISFFVRASTLNVRNSDGQTFPIAVPERNFVAHLNGYRITNDGGGSCQIVNGETICPPNDIIKAIADALNITEQQAMLVLIALPAGAVGIAVVAKMSGGKKRHVNA